MTLFDSKKKRESEMLTNSALFGLTDTVKAMLETGVDVDARDPHGWTALMFAAQEGHIAIVKTLLEKDADVNKKGKKKGFTALICAARTGHSEIVRVLLAHEADTEKKDKNGRTALEWAKLCNHFNVIGVFEDKDAGVKAEDLGDDTSIVGTLYKAETNKIRVIQDISPDAGGGGGGSALMIAVLKGDAATVKSLLEGGFNVNMKNERGNTALIAAALSGHNDIVQVLLAHGADINIKNKKGKTSLMASVLSGHADVVQILLSHGADINAKDEEGLTALMYAANTGYVEIVESLLDAEAKE